MIAPMTRLQIVWKGMTTNIVLKRRNSTLMLLSKWTIGAFTHEDITQKALICFYVIYAYISL